MKSPYSSLITSLAAVLAVGVYLVVLAQPAFAGGGHSGEPASILDTLPYWYNFIPFVLILFYLLKNPFVAFYQSRRSELEDAVNAGRKEMLEAQAELKAAQEKVSSLAEDKESVRKNMMAETHQEAERIKEEAKAKVERIGTQAESAIQAETLAAENALRKELSEIVLEKAEQRLRSELTADSDKEIRQAAVSSLKSVVQ